MPQVRLNADSPTTPATRETAAAGSVTTSRTYAPSGAGLPAYSALRAAFLDGSDSPRHYLERLLARIEGAEGAVQAFVALDVEGARRAADDAAVRFRENRPLSPVDGMPVAVKDIIETRNLPTQMNSPIYAGWTSRRDAACVVGLRRAGAWVLGKTVTTEFACGRSGPTRNPWDLERTPGGSSSGSAAAVGAGMAPAAIGTQTQASVIRPASYCGAYAIKPSHGLASFDGAAPLAISLDTLGFFGASLEDAWGVLAAAAAVGAPHAPRPPLPMTPPAPARPARLIRLDTDGWDEVDAASRAVFETALAQLRAEGVEILDRRAHAEVEALEQTLRQVTEASLRIFAWESQWPLRAYAELGDDLVGVRIKDLLELADGMTTADAEAALAVRDRLRAQVASLSGLAQGFLALASSGPAIADIAYTGSRRYPVPWSMTGAPALSLPALVSAGLPLGLQVMGFRGGDEQIVAAALWIDAALALSPAAS